MYIFLIFGAISLAWAIVFLLLMPDIPSKARFLAAEEKVVAVERVAVNRQGVKNHHFKKYQMWQMFRDPKTWILFIMSVRRDSDQRQTQICPADRPRRLRRRYPMPLNPVFVSRDSNTTSQSLTEVVHGDHPQDFRIRRSPNTIYAYVRSARPVH